MIRTDIIGIGLPDRLAARGGEEANPDQDIITVGAQRMARTRPVQRQIEEVTVEVWIVDLSTLQDQRDVGVQANRRPAFLNDDRRV